MYSNDLLFTLLEQSILIGLSYNPKNLNFSEFLENALVLGINISTAEYANTASLPATRKSTILKSMYFLFYRSVT